MASASSESDYASASSDIECEHPTLLQLPEALVQEVLKWLDPLSLCLASQACVSLLRSASALRGPPQQQHYLVATAKACLGSVLHLPPWALDCCLDFTHSVRFPLSLAMHSLRSSLAASDVYDVAERTARAMQASVYRAQEMARAGAGCAPLASGDPMLTFSSCRADRGYVRLCLRVPAVAQASLAHLRPALARVAGAQLDGSLFLDGSYFQQLRTELLLCLGVDIRSDGMEKVPASSTRSHAAAAECVRCYRRLLADWLELVAVAEVAIEGLADAAGQEAAGPADVQLLVSLEQAWSKGGPAAAAGSTAGRQAGGSPSPRCVEAQQHEQRQQCWAACLLAAGAAVSDHMKGCLGSLLGSLHAAPPSALATMAALLRNNIAAQEAGQCQGGGRNGPDVLLHSVAGSSLRNGSSSVQEGGTSAASAVPLSLLLVGVAEAHPREALTALVQLAALGVMQEAAQQVLNVC
ncbi:hypothetical protein N2152v2_008245 [Parachlorella kessleri]